MGSTKLDGRVALITGATHGIGREVARQLVGVGATVIVTARDAERATDAVASSPTSATCVHSTSRSM